MPAVITPPRWGAQKPPAGAMLRAGHPLAQGLVGCWLFHEHGGLVTRNLAGPAVLPDVQAVAWGANRGGVGLIQTGGSSHRGASTLTGALPFTVVLRCTLTNIDGSNHDIWAATNGGSSVYHGLAVSSGGQLYFYAAGTSNATEPGTTTSGDLVHTVCVAASATERRLYKNGLLAATDTGSYTPSVEHWSLGSWPLVGSGGGAGIDNELYIYNRALSPAEVAQLYAEPYAMLGAPAPRPRYWVFSSTPQLAYPTSDVSDGSWLNESGSATNLYASVDEVTLDEADWIQSSSNPQDDAVELGLGTLDDPTVHTGHKLKVWWKRV